MTQTLDANILLKIPHGSINSNKEPLGMRLRNIVFPGLCCSLWGVGSEGKGPWNEIGFQTNLLKVHKLITLVLYVPIQCMRRMWTHFDFSPQI